MGPQRDARQHAVRGRWRSDRQPARPVAQRQWQLQRGTQQGVRLRRADAAAARGELLVQQLAVQLLPVQLHGVRIALVSAAAAGRGRHRVHPHRRTDYAKLPRSRPAGRWILRRGHRGRRAVRRTADAKRVERRRHRPHQQRHHAGRLRAGDSRPASRCRERLLGPVPGVPTVRHVGDPAERIAGDLAGLEGQTRPRSGHFAGRRGPGPRPVLRLAGVVRDGPFDDLRDRDPAASSTEPAGLRRADHPTGRRAGHRRTAARLVRLPRRGPRQPRRTAASEVEHQKPAAAASCRGFADPAAS